MGKGQQYSTEGLGRQQSSKLRVQNHLNHIPPMPHHTGEPETNSFSAKLDFKKSGFDSNQLMSNSNHTSYATKSNFCNSEEAVRSDSAQQKDYSNFDQPINHQTSAAVETPIFNHVNPTVSSIVNPMLSTFVCPLVTAPNPVTRISSSSSKVSDV